MWNREKRLAWRRVRSGAAQSPRWLRRLPALLCLVMLLAVALWRPLTTLRARQATARADHALHAAHGALRQLRLQLRAPELRSCFSAWTGASSAPAGECGPALAFLTQLQAAGLVLPLPSGSTLAAYARQRVCDGGCFFAGNLRDAQLVMPNYIFHLAQILSALAEAGNYVFVSIYESGSSDRTGGWLLLLRELLDALNVQHDLQLHGTIQRAKGEERIHFLARVRSAALTPLYAICAAVGAFCPPDKQPNVTVSEKRGGGRVVFLNDVLFTAADVLRLLQYPADLVCGLDLGMAAQPDMNAREHQDTVAAYLQHRWLLPGFAARTLSRARGLKQRWLTFHQRNEPLLREFGPLYFYDKWVARDISGRMFTNRAPYVVYTPSRERVVAGRPVRVHCCWNGLAIMDAEPLVSRRVQFREHAEGECSASECSLLCDDFWRLGYSDVVLDPNVRVTYDLPGARRLYREFTADAALGAPGIAYTAFRPQDVAEVMALPRHDDVSRESGGGLAPRIRQVDCCDLAKGADMVEFRDAGVCHNATVVIGG